MNISLEVTAHGPMFDGHPGAELSRAVRDGVDDAGEEAVRLVQTTLDNVLVNPTGFYRDQITYSLRRDNTEAFIGDNRAVMGPWLEGTGSRNRTTRFKGYSTFRKTAQQMERRAPAIIERHIARAVARLD